MDKEVIRDYNHMTSMDENANKMKLTHLLSEKSLNLGGPLFYIYLHFKILNGHFIYKY